MVRSSFKASLEGIEEAGKAFRSSGLSKKDFAEKARVSRSTFYNFLKRIPVDPTNFQEICHQLGLNWEKIRELPPEKQKSNINSSVINALVQNIRKKVHQSIEETCGTMRILDMTQPIELGSIYTQVNILDKITGRRGYDVNQLLANVDLEDFDRFCLSNIREKKVEGLKAVRNYSKLMVLGKPGAGKTTFLKYLAIECSKRGQEEEEKKEDKLNNCVPVFITLKQFAETEIEGKVNPGLLDHISHWLGECGVKEAQKEAEQILKAGKAFVLLDGLDEVREEDSDRVIKEIRDFSEKFSSSQFIITCRIAAKDYTFDKFTEVEVADFGDEQIKYFAQSWFKIKVNNSEADDYSSEFIQQLEDNNQIKELATNPLLLTLLCLEFEDSRSFPADRAELYKRATETLLRKWDDKRGIKRKQVYGQLSVKRKEDLLSQVAFSTFNEKQYFFKRRVVEDRIADYIINLPNAPTDKEKLDIDSGAVLKSIEAQHGLLVERARGIYSFSHLTFQEYFTAQKIVSEQAESELAKHITEKRWREVFLLTAGMFTKIDRLVKLMKQQVDELQPKDKNIQDFFSWVNRKANSLETKHKRAEVRTLYIGIGLLISRDLSRDLSLYLSRDLSFYLSLYLSPDLSLYLSRYLSPYLSPDLSRYLSPDLSRYLSPYLSQYLIRELDSFIPSENKKDLQNLAKQLSHEDDNLEKVEQEIKQWLEDNVLVWSSQLKGVMIDESDYQLNWEFSKEQIESLQQYFDANYLLLECMKNGYMTCGVREEIKSSLYLPVRGVGV